MNNSEVNTDAQYSDDEFEALNELENESDPLGIILAYSIGGGPADCW